MTDDVLSLHRDNSSHYLPVEWLRKSALTVETEK